MDPHRRQLHVTMAHQYLPEHHSSLEELARAKVDPQAPAKWEMRMYSRDHRLGSSEVSALCISEGRNPLSTDHDGGGGRRGALSSDQ